MLTKLIISHTYRSYSQPRLCTVQFCGPGQTTPRKCKKKCTAQHRQDMSKHISKPFLTVPTVFEQVPSVWEVFACLSLDCTFPTRTPYCSCCCCLTMDLAGFTPFHRHGSFSLDIACLLFSLMGVTVLYWLLGPLQAPSRCFNSGLISQQWKTMPRLRGKVSLPVWH